MTNPANNTSVLSIENVSASYNGPAVIRDVNLDISQGQIFGLIGLNGAGKTTLIKTILGLREQDAGEVKILGAERNSKTAKTQLSYLPERFSPPWFLTGLEFLRFSLKLYGQKKSDDVYFAAAESIALDKNALRRKVNTYSKGMRQKLGLLATLLAGCHLTILDEPMSGLDPRARAHVKDMLKEQELKKNTIFLSSHVLADMDEICDQIAVLHNGEVQYVGAPQALKEKVGADNLERAFLQYIEQSEAA